MRGILLILPALVTSVGCGTCGKGAGFTMAYHLPPTVSQQVMVGPQVTQYAAQGLATGPVAGGVGVFSAEAVESAPLAMRAPQRAIPAPQRSVMSDCTMEEICRMLRELQRSIERQNETRRMPPGD